jgi:hypothetical protein
MTSRKSGKVLMISPHFPPDSSAGAHRVRLLAPHLERYGWSPTVLTVDSAFYEGELDPGLARLVPSDLRVIRAPAIRQSVSRLLGVGDLGLRSFPGLYRAARKLLESEKFDALFITIYPTYTALLGPLLKKRYGIPFVLDYQDPWVGSWGKTVGAGNDGSVDWRSRGSRTLALSLEPIAVRSADAITAVSAQTVGGVTSRIPEARTIPVVTIPIGGEPADFEKLRHTGADNPFFNPGDGSFHLCYVGTILPLGIETLRAFLQSLTLLRAERPDLYEKLRVHFFGTSNERVPDPPARVLTHARELGVDQIITEHPMRIDYSHAVKVQLDAAAILLMGSSEPHYTASKLYPALLARRPLLAAYHKDSTVSHILENVANPHVCLVRYDRASPPLNHVIELKRNLIQLMENPSPDPTEDMMSPELSAESLARILGSTLDQASKEFSAGQN